MENNNWTWISRERQTCRQTKTSIYVLSRSCSRTQTYVDDTSAKNDIIWTSYTTQCDVGDEFQYVWRTMRWRRRVLIESQAQRKTNAKRHKRHNAMSRRAHAKRTTRLHMRRQKLTDTIDMTVAKEKKPSMTLVVLESASTPSCWWSIIIESNFNRMKDFMDEKKWWDIIGIVVRWRLSTTKGYLRRRDRQLKRRLCVPQSQANENEAKKIQSQFAIKNSKSKFDFTLAR